VRALSLTLALVAATNARAAEAAPAEAWELDGFAGYGQLAYPALDTATTTWSNGSGAFALGVAYRGPHFTHPFAELSYVPMISSGSHVYVTSGTGSPVTQTFASNSSWAWGLTLGPGWDVDWFRIRAGIGFYNVYVRATAAGETNTSSKINVGFLAAATAMVWRPDPFALGVEARLVALQAPTAGIFQSMWQIGLAGRWDFARH
jgi:opacity protein-like surface antigen